MNENRTPAETARRSRTRKTTVFFAGTHKVYQMVTLEVPSDATEEEITDIDESAWKHLTPHSKWTLEPGVIDVWDNEVELELSDEPDDVTVDVRLARTIEGQLVVLAN
jgi:hypothetical protein